MNRYKYSKINVSILSLDLIFAHCKERLTMTVKIKSGLVSILVPFSPLFGFYGLLIPLVCFNLTAIIIRQFGPHLFSAKIKKKKKALKTYSTLLSTNHQPADTDGQWLVITVKQLEKYIFLYLPEESAES